jgi:hypothetical protein
MSGVIKINDGTTWVKSGWMHDDVLKMMIGRLSPGDEQLRELLMNGRTDRVGYCDLSGLDNAQFNKLVSAAAVSYLEMRAAGPKSFAQPAYYPGYMKQFEILLDMFKNDPRAAKLAS